MILSPGRFYPPHPPPPPSSPGLLAAFDPKLVCFSAARGRGGRRKWSSRYTTQMWVVVHDYLLSQRQITHSELQQQQKKKTGNLCLWLGLLRNYLQLLRGTVVPNISLEKNQSSVWDGQSQEVLGVSQSHCTTVLHWSRSWAQKSHAHLAQHVCDWMVSLAAAPAVEVDHRSIKRWTDWVVMGTQTHIDPVCY